MKNIKQSLSIVIPAYNEASNIKELLQEILCQDIRLANLKEIIVYSDGSTDATVETVKTLGIKKCTVICSDTRSGITNAWNQLFMRASGSIVVMLNADIALFDHNFIDRLISPIIFDQAELTSAEIHELPAEGWVGKSLIFSMKLKRIIFSCIRNGHSVYSCYGPARAICRKLYKEICFPQTMGDDMFSYLYCLSRHQRFISVRSARVWYQIPENRDDYKKQSMRFQNATNSMEEYFSSKLVSDAFAMPLFSLVLGAIKALPFLVVNLPYAFCYLYLLLSVRFYDATENEELWSVTSTKKLRRIYG